MFGAFLKLGKRMFESQLNGSEYASMDEKMMDETASECAKDNVSAKRDFGMFDRISERETKSIRVCNREFNYV